MKLIGISSSLSTSQTYVNTAYVSAFTRKGITPIIIPQLTVKNRELLTRESFMEVFGSHIDEWADKLSGLCLSGGQDLNPVAFDEINYQSNNVDITRDYMELALIEAFVKAGKPVLGICRGHQLLSRFLNLSNFQQDLSMTSETHILAGDKVHRQEPCHQVYLYGALKAYLEEKTGQDHLPSVVVNSHHHQGLTLTPDGKIPKHVKSRDFGPWYLNRKNEYEAKHEIDLLATTPLVIEAFEKRDTKVLGYQHHPEEAGSDGLFIQYWLDSFFG